MKGYLYLFIAIFGELIATSSLKASQGFSKLVPSLIVIIGYGTAFYFLSLSLKYIPLGISYAIWSGVGTALTAIIGYWFWKESLNIAQLIGIILIIAGVVLLNLSKNASA
ncbi:DMT family transporter [Thermoflavimicrobium dichotomicum]|uniref:Small multidrug resistance pump n=1 Tax=Thermoflavimicrobium dichotomicum TaxID=46223 RepID=A0A1I3UR88_9BACL|nr:multidrug efflux SMR transporter [Thermoflavimicrobium dichotomicum]SFJ85858.1 small multidrug resistance pump [Thermoflavimicrobium dichotomicum]